MNSPRTGRFHTTRWSLVLAAGRPTGKGSAEALASLCEIYWQPVYAVIRCQGHNAEEARDLTQGFFTCVLEKRYFKDANRARGRFRAFLSTSVRHFLSNERDRATALKRGGTEPPLALDINTAEGWCQVDVRDDLTPEKVFDRRWALVLLERVLSRLRQHWFEAEKAEQFDCLRGFLTGDSEAVTYAQAARQLRMSEGAIKVAVHRLRRQFRDLLLQEIAETVLDPDEIDAEVQYLLKAVGS